MRTRLLAIEGRQVEVAEWAGAEASPLVLLHEGLGSAALWRGFPAALQAASGRRVVAYSRFGHGDSDPPPRPRTREFFHEEAMAVLPELLSALDLEDPVLLGHSDGASIALIYAAAHPIPGQILIAPHVFVEPITITAIEAARERFDSGDLRQRLARHHADPELAFNGWCDVWLDPSFASWSLAAEISALRTRTLLIQGSEDPYGSAEQLARIETGSRAETSRTMVPGGHNPHLEATDAVISAIASFLARID